MAVRRNDEPQAGDQDAGEHSRVETVSDEGADVVPVEVVVAAAWTKWQVDLEWIGKWVWDAPDESMRPLPWILLSLAAAVLRDDPWKSWDRTLPWEFVVVAVVPDERPLPHLCGKLLGEPSHNPPSCWEC